MIASHSQLRDSESQGPKNRQTNCNFFRQENGVCRNERHIAGGSLRGAGNDAGRNGYPLLLVSLYLTQTQNLRRPIEESREQQRRLPARAITTAVMRVSFFIVFVSPRSGSKEFSERQFTA